jgi:hypothetical protein
LSSPSQNQKEPIIIDINDGSSTTSNEEEFHSWRQKLNKVNTNWNPYPLPCMAEFRSQVDPELFKDDVLLFDEDLEDFEVQPAAVASLKIDNSPKLVSPPLKKSTNITVSSNNQDKSAAHLYSTTSNQFYSPPSPPSIFNRSKKKDNFTTSTSETLKPQINQLEQSSSSKKFYFKPRPTTSNASFNTKSVEPSSSSTYSSFLSKNSDWIDPSRQNPVSKSQPFKKPLVSFPRPHSSSSCIFDLSDDDDFLIPGQDDSNKKKIVTQSSSSSGINNSTLPPKIKKKKRKVDCKNPFVELYADVSGGDDSDSDSNDDEELDEYDRSFVDSGDDVGVTDS